MLCALIGSFSSLAVFSPVLILEMIEVRSSLIAYSVRRSAFRSLQISWLDSSMIWSMFSVSWMRVVTSWSWRKNSASNVTPRLSGGNCCESKKACVSLPWRSTALIGISWSGGTGNRCSQFELLAGTQPTDVVRDIRAEGLGLIEPLDLGHDQLRFGGLGVRDVDRERVARLDAVQLLGQRQRRQV